VPFVAETLCGLLANPTTGFAPSVALLGIKPGVRALIKPLFWGFASTRLSKETFTPSGQSLSQYGRAERPRGGRGKRWLMQPLVQALWRLQ
jgi:hypothetical protein